MDESETHILEINLISAQGLEAPSSMRRRFKTYAVAWVDSSCKLRSRLDSDGSQNPTWNDKFLFRVTPDFLCSDTAGVSVQIYAAGFLRDRLIGSVRLLISNFLPGGAASSVSAASCALRNPSFTALQIRRPSGSFQGILNLAVMLVADMLVADSDFPGFAGIWAMGHRDLTRRHPRRTPSRDKLTVSSAESECSPPGKLVEFKGIQILEGKERLTEWSFAKLLCRLFAEKTMTQPPSDRKNEISEVK